MDISTSQKPRQFTYSSKSKKQLSTCHPYIQMIFNTAIRFTDITILEGYRNEEDQNKAYENGFSKLKFPNSKHNVYPSMAVDAVPFPIDWKDTQRLTYFVGFIIGLSRLLLKGTGYKLVSGIDWNDNFYTKDHSFLDYPHFELVLDDNNKLA